MKCPICEKEITDYSSDYLEHTMCEEHAKCKDEHHFYNYSYCYGTTEETIGAVVFYSHYRDTDEDIQLRGKQYRAVLRYEKEAYQKKITKGESKE